MKQTCLIFFCLLLAAEMLAVPAYRGKIKVRQPDGTVLTFYMVGDERNHYCMTTDGYPLVQDEAGAYRYAVQGVDGRLTYEGSPVAHDPEMRQVYEISYVGKLEKAADLQPVKTAARVMAVGTPASAVSDGKASRFQIGNFPVKGKGRCLVLLVEFVDTKFTLDKDLHHRMLNEEGFSEDGATGSARDYYYSQSYGQFEPQFDVVGPITLSRTASYYGRDEYFGGTDVNAGDMIYEACNLAKSEYGVDFSEYDGDGDGKVDMVYVIYAGYGQNAGAGADAIWPHMFELSSWGMSLTLDGKAIDTYACSAELDGNSGTRSAGIGTVCHEFGHVLGLADHYNTTDGSDYKLGRYDIMDYGAYNNDSRTPPAYTAFERMTLGWITPEEIDEPEDGLTLGPLSETGKAYLLTTSDPDEFYLLENRQKEGWDSHIPESGMIITHVAYNEAKWIGNVVNDDTDHPRYYIVAADNELGYNEVLKRETEKYDVYPNALGNDSFTDESVPAAKPYTGETLDKWVTSISKGEDGMMSFDFRVNHLKKADGLRAEQTGSDSFMAYWDAVDKAGEYALNLYTLDFRSMQANALEEGFALMAVGSEDAPDSKDISDELDDYTVTQGWSGTNVFQAGGWCCIGKTSAGGTLALPELNLKRFDGKFAVAVRVKSMEGSQPVLTVSANGMEGKTRIKSMAQTFVFRFQSGISKTSICVSTNTGMAFIDTVAVVRGDAEGLFDDAREIAVSGTPEIEEGEVEDKDFIHVDTLSVDGVKDISYLFENLKTGTYYSFAVKAFGEGSDSEFSDECVIYLDPSVGIRVVNQEHDSGAAVQVYTLDGRKVSGVCGKGIYIVRKGNTTRKVIIK